MLRFLVHKIHALKFTVNVTVPLTGHLHVSGDPCSLHAVKRV